MSDGDIKITIGAVKSASVARVWRDIRKDGRLTAIVLNRALNPDKWVKGLTAYSVALRGVMKDAKGLTSEVRERGQAQRKAASDEERAGRRIDQAERERERQRKSDATYLHNLRMRHLRQEDAERRRADREQKRAIQRFSRTTSHRATRFMFPNAPIMSYAARAAGDIARGYGADLSPGSHIANNVQTEKLATHISNTSIIDNDDRNSERVSVDALQSTARSSGKALGYTPEVMLGALEAFKKPTGDLATAIELLPKLGELAAAFGADADALFGAAGEMSQQLIDVRDSEKAAALVDVMKTFTGQGVLGAVEIEDLASYGARLAAPVGAYEGDRTENLKKMGALAQAARGFGGADSAAMSATAVARLKTTFSTPARVAAFKERGIDVVGESGKIRDPVQLIKEAIVATDGSPTGFNDLFKNVMGARPAEGLKNIFGGAKKMALKGGSSESEAVGVGLKAIDDYIDKMMTATTSQERINDNLEQVRKTIAFQSNELNIAFDGIAADLMQELTPALKEAVPSLKEFAETLGEVATWVVTNPKSAIGAAIGLSIARAGIETTMRVGIEKAMEGAAGNFAGAATKWFSGAAIAGVVSFTIANAVLKLLDSDYASNDRTTFENLGDIGDFIKNGMPGAAPGEDAPSFMSSMLDTIRGAIAPDFTPDGSGSGPLEQLFSPKSDGERQSDAIIKDLKRSLVDEMRKGRRATERLTEVVESSPGAFLPGTTSQHGDPG